MLGKRKIFFDNNICKLCDYTSIDHKGMDQHIRNMHIVNIRNKYICTTCDLLFIVGCKLLNHMKSIHDINIKIQPFYCNLCNKRYTTHENLQHHTKISHFCEYDENINKSFSCNKISVCCNSGKNKCFTCNIRFETKSQVYYHNKFKHNKDSYICNICSISFKTFHILTDHKKNLHSIVTTYTCNTCSNKYNSKYNIYNHIFNKHLTKSTKKLYDKSIQITKYITNYHKILKRNTENKEIPQQVEDANNLNIGGTYKLSNSIEITNFYIDSCPICYEWFSVLIQLDAHILECHANISIYFFDVYIMNTYNINNCKYNFI